MVRSRSIGGDSGAKAGHPESGSRADGWTGEERSFRCQFCEGLIKGVAIITVPIGVWESLPRRSAGFAGPSRSQDRRGCKSQGNSLCINHKLHRRFLYLCASDPTAVPPPLAAAKVASTKHSSKLTRPSSIN